MRDARVLRALFAVALVVALVGSMTGATSADTWNEYVHTPDGFAISGPFEPTPSTADFGSGATPLPTRLLNWRIPGGVVLFMSVTDYSGSASESVDATLASVIDGQLSTTKDGKLVYKNPVTLQGVKGLDCLIEGSEVHSRTRVFRKGDKVWQMLSLSSKNVALYDQTDRWFASFRFTTPAP